MADFPVVVDNYDAAFRSAALPGRGIRKSLKSSAQNIDYDNRPGAMYTSAASIK